jgi:hypothetical protein
MFDQVVKAVGDLEGVLGFQVRSPFFLSLALSIYPWLTISGTQMMNEPHRGYLEIPSLHSFDYNTDLHLSHVRKSLLLPPSLFPF